VHDQRKLIVTQKFETELAFVELSGAPKLLLAPPFPANLITVPACYDCNQSFQKDDEYTRFITGIDFRASKTKMRDQNSGCTSIFAKTYCTGICAISKQSDYKERNS
jgi:hypothetical protein